MIRPNSCLRTEEQRSQQFECEALEYGIVMATSAELNAFLSGEWRDQ